MGRLIKDLEPGHHIGLGEEGRCFTEGPWHRWTIASNQPVDDRTRHLVMYDEETLETFEHDVPAFLAVTEEELTDEEVQTVARMVAQVGRHYGRHLVTRQEGVSLVVEPVDVRVAVELYNAPRR